MRRWRPSSVVRAVRRGFTLIELMVVMAITGLLIALGTVAIGAITFTGSIIAFGKLQGLITGKPLIFPMQHPLNAVLAILTVVLVVLLCTTQSTFAFWLIVPCLWVVAISLFLRYRSGGRRGSRT